MRDECDHGNLRRQCELCEVDEHIASLVAERDAALLKLGAAEKLCANYEKLTKEQDAAQDAMHRATVDLQSRLSSGSNPIPMVLHCPACGAQHIDAPELERGWDNPPHKSHLCHGCGAVWRPAGVPTTGVASLDRVGVRDTWKPGDSTSSYRLDAIRKVVEPAGRYLFSGHVNALAEVRAILDARAVEIRNTFKGEST